MRPDQRVREALIESERLEDEKKATATLSALRDAPGGRTLRKARPCPCAIPLPAPELLPAPVGTTRYNGSSVKEWPTVATPSGGPDAKAPAASGDPTPVDRLF